MDIWSSTLKRDFNLEDALKRSDGQGCPSSSIRWSESTAPKVPLKVPMVRGPTFPAFCPKGRQFRSVGLAPFDEGSLAVLLYLGDLSDNCF